MNEVIGYNVVWIGMYEDFMLVGGTWFWCD